MRKIVGMSLLELMIVIAVLAMLAVIAVPTYRSFVARAKRSEAYAQLHALYIAEQGYYTEHGTYSSILSGDGGIGWKPQGKCIYVYGFAGGPQNHGGSESSGALGAFVSTSATENAFCACAAGDIDGDGVYDVLTVDQNGEILIVKDDIAGS